MKKLISIAVLLAVFCSYTVHAASVDYGEELVIPEQKTEQKFSDVPLDYWAFQYINEMAERKVITGYPDGKFRPENTVTRAEFAKIMVGAAGLEAKAVNYSSFADIPASDWSSPFVETAKEYMTYYKGNDSYYLFKPENGAIREDIAVALVKLKGYDVRLADLSIIQAMFSDYDGISESTKKYVALAVENGLMSGYPDETFRGQATITRAEAATLLWRAYQYGNDNKVVDDTPVVNRPEAPVIPGNETPVPSHTPSPPASPAPTPEIKKYSTETLLKADGVESIVIDSNDTIYFLKDNTVQKLKNGKMLEVANGDTDFACEYTREELTKYLNESDSTKNMEFKKFMITGLVYDRSANDVLAVGNYKRTVSAIEENVAVWSLGQHKILADKVYLNHGYGRYPTGRLLALNGDQLIMEISKTAGAFYNSNYLRLIRADLSSGTIHEFSERPAVSVSYSRQCATYLNGKYTILYGENIGTLSMAQYDPAKSGFVGTEFRDNSGSNMTIDCIRAFDGLIYLFMDGNVYRMNAGGEIQLFINADEIEFKDMLPIRDVVSEFVLDSKGNIIFYDVDTKSIRRINVV